MKLLLSLFLAAAVMAVVITSEAEGVAAAAADCTPTDLLPCLPAITSGAAPTKECCGKLKDQEDCLCRYSKNPDFGKYVSSPNAKKVIDACDVPHPSCTSNKLHSVEEEQQ